MRLNAVLDYYYKSYHEYSNRMWAGKLGIVNFEEEDQELINELISNLQMSEIDMTIFFRLLSSMKDPEKNHLKPAFYNEDEVLSEKWDEWLAKWWHRVDGNPEELAMLGANPKYVLRNWMAQMAIDSAEDGDYSVAMELHEMLKDPYAEQPKYEEKWYRKRPEWARNRIGCSMLSCSS